MHRFVSALACLTCACLGRRVHFPNDRILDGLHKDPEVTKKDSIAFANRSVQEPQRQQSLVQLTATSNRRHFTGDSKQALASFLFGRLWATTTPEPTGWQRFAGGLTSAATSISTSVGDGVVEYMDRRARQRRMKTSNHEILLLALLAARLSAAVYADTQEDLEKELSSPAYSDVPGGFKILHFNRQGPHQNNEKRISPQWFLARGALPSWQAGEVDVGIDDEALFLVFRGTWSTSDLIRDACIAPEEQQNSGCFHGGFLKGVRDDPDLHTHLRRAMRRGCNHLYVFGHSLGGSLAMTLVAAGLLPTWYTGNVTVVGVGAPPIIATSASHTMDGCKALNTTSNHIISSGPTSRYVLVVNDCDVIPRLLGSPMPVSLSKVLASSVVSPMQQALMQRNVELMETMQQYSHPEGVETILLRDGRAKDVPSEALESVLHLGEAVSPQLFDHHRTANYVSELEIATTLAEILSSHGESWIDI